MTLSTALLVPIVLSVMFIVFSLGARTTLDDLLYMFRHPALFVRAILAIYIIVPAAAVTLSLALPLSLNTQLVLIALAVSPIPPILPVKQVKAGAERRYAISLLASASLLSFILTPFLLNLASNILDAGARIAVRDISVTLVGSLEMPLIAGMLFRRFIPKWADTAHDYTRKAGIVLLLAGMAAVLAIRLPMVLSLIGDGTVIAMAGMVFVGLLAGHWLGGPDYSDSAALSLAASTRHPGVALAIVTANIPDARPVALAAVILFFAVNLLLTIPYGRWMRRRVEAATTPTT